MMDDVLDLPVGGNSSFEGARAGVVDFGGEDDQDDGGLKKKQKAKKKTGAFQTFGIPTCARLTRRPPSASTFMHGSVRCGVMKCGCALCRSVSCRVSRGC